MYKTILLSILLGIVLSEEAVHTLTSDNFESFIKEHSRVLVEFYAPWCGHCKALAPEYEKAAKKLLEDDIDAVLAKVDATEEKDLGAKYGVRGFPTLKYFTNGDIDNPSDYNGGRTEDTIVSWITVRSLPAVSKLTTKEEIDTFKNKGKVTIIGFTSNEKHIEIINTVAENNRDSVLIGLVSTNELAKEYNTELNNILLFAEWEEKPIKFEIKNDFNEDSLTNFINNERFPLIDAIGPENYKHYMDRGLPLVWISVDASDDEKVNNVKNSLLKYAKEFKGKLSFTYVDNVKFAQHVQQLGITSKPGLLIADEPKKYRFEGDLFNENDVETFFNSYADGSLEAWVKTEPVPETNDEPVYVLVGSEFDNIIGGDNDVFVEFYAPWCGHCKRLAPEYEKVGEAFQDVSNIIIAKIDATANDTPEEIKGFPTLIFYKKGEKTGIKYNGDREADAIIQYIKENASVDISNLKEDL